MIRKIEEKDFQMILNLIVEYLSSHTNYKKANEENILSCLKDSLNSNENLYIITDDFNNAKGYINFSIINFPLIGGKELYISELFISTDCRGNHYGSQLLQFAISTAKEANCKRIMLNNSMESLSFKRNFYKNFGFIHRDSMANFVLPL